jgi:hypothetical protein
MFIKRTKTASGSNVFTYLQLVESVRRGGRSTHRVIANLGREDQLNRRQIDRLIAALAPYGGGEVVCSENLRILAGKEHGSLLALDAVWRTLGLDTILSEAGDERRFEFPPGLAIKAMVMARVLRPGSDKGTLRWRDHVHMPEFESLRLQHLYRGLDFLVEVKDHLEARLVQVLSERLLADLNLVLFDTTSVYFEGDGPDGLARFGYSRDRRSDRPQVVLGLLTTADGLPLSHVVLPGNTTDPTSLQQAMRLAAERLPVSQIVLVIDRGMVSEENLRRMEAMGLQYIAGMRHRQLATRDALRRGGRYRRVAANLLVKEVQGGPRRLVVCHNPEEAQRDERERAGMVAYLERQLEDHGVKGLLRKGVTKRYVKLEGGTAQIDRERIEEDRSNDGKWVLVTNCVFRTKPNTQSGANRTRVSDQTVQRFAGNRTLVEVAQGS